MTEAERLAQLLESRSGCSDETKQAAVLLRSQAADNESLHNAMFEAHKILIEQRAEIERLREVLVSFTKSDYIKKQHPKRYAAARAALENKHD